tara:strand:- start:158 stop:322 length:165 start_codon:yes stop_codon:yes gene_type:complete
MIWLETIFTGIGGIGVLGLIGLWAEKEFFETENLIFPILFILIGFGGLKLIGSF